MTSESEPLINKMYELTRQEIHLLETTYLFQLIVLVLTTIGFVIWYIATTGEGSGPSRFKTFFMELSRSCLGLALIICLIFITTFILSWVQIDLIRLGYDNRAIELEVLKEKAPTLGSEYRTFQNLDSMGASKLIYKPSSVRLT